MTTENRRNEWFALAAFSTIALVAITSDMVGDLGDQQDEVKWSAVSLIIALGVSGLAFFAHALENMFVGTIIEGGLGLAVFGILAGGISTIMNPDNRIAQTTTGGIANANLYFFSWGAFICSLQVLSKYLRDIHNIGLAPSDKAFSATGWTGFAASCFVVMAAATRLYKSKDCDDVDSGDNLDDFCVRTKFAISLGAICGIVGVLWVWLGARLPVIVDAIMGITMLAGWCFGVGYITFGGDKAPAQELGNLYFATWATFVMATKLSGDGAGKVFHFATGGGDEEMEEHQEVAPKDMAGGDEKGGDGKGDEQEGVDEESGHDSA